MMDDNAKHKKLASICDLVEPQEVKIRLNKQRHIKL